MKLENGFDVPVPVEEAWPMLLDIKQIAPCLPGAVIDSVDGDDYSGRVKIKAGPITVSYAGVIRMADVDEANRTVVMDAQGKEQRGSGTVKALITARVTPAGSGSHVDVDTDLAITGKPAQLGRGLIADVSGKIIGQFAKNLGEQMVAPAETASSAEPAGAGAAEAPRPVAPAAPAAPADDSLDMLELLRPHLLRAGAGLGLLLLLALLVRRIARH